MSSDQPKISVLMAAYNAASHVQLSIRSILDQTCSDFEFIIINDGSEDQTARIVESIGDSRIVLKMIPRSGLASALNVGIKVAKGQFIARMDADDVALPDRLKSQVKFLTENPGIDVVGTAYEVLKPDGLRSKSSVPFCVSDTEIKRALPRFNPLFHGSVMMRREAVLAVGGYDERFLLAQDYDLWLRMSKKFKFANLDQILMIRREDDRTIQKEARQNWFAIKARLNAIRNGSLKFWHIIYLIRPLLVVVTPNSIKQLIRKFIP